MAKIPPKPTARNTPIPAAKYFKTAAFVYLIDNHIATKPKRLKNIDISPSPTILKSTTHIARIPDKIPKNTVTIPTFELVLSNILTSTF